MAVVASRVTVSTSAVLLIQNTSPDPGEGDYRSWRVLLKNVTGTASVFVGTTGVTNLTGFQWDATDGALAVELEPGESLYGVVTGANQVVHILKVGR